MVRVGMFIVAVFIAEFVLAQETPVVHVGSKASIENIVLGEVLTHLVRDGGAKAEHVSSLGGTQFVFRALQKGEIDVYPEYTGTLIAEILQGEKIRGEDGLQAALDRLGLAVSKPLGFNNTYAIGLKDDVAEKLGLTKISDLARPEHAELRMGFSEEFMGRSDGWPGLAGAYKLPHRPKTMDHSLAYHGIASQSIDVTDLYSTDAEIKYYKLRILEDDRGYFPPYNCVLLYRKDLAARAPKVHESIKRLEGAIDGGTMCELNARVKTDHFGESVVAADFLQEKLGIKVVAVPKPNQLLTTTWRHLLLVSVSLSAAIIVALPLGIWSYKWPKLGHAILGTVGIIQTLPSMAVLCFMITFLPVGPLPAIVALFLYSLLPIVRGTVTGLREIPENLKESAIVLGLPPRAKLWLVELPMASRSILSGIKTAAVINVGTATIGALVGAGGYGAPILSGLRLFDIPLILSGAVPAALLALAVQAGFEALEPFLVPRGLRIAAAGKG